MHDSLAEVVALQRETLRRSEVANAAATAAATAAAGKERKSDTLNHTSCTSLLWTCS